MKLDQYEKHFYDILLEMGFNKNEIVKPDDTNNKNKEPDFLIEKINTIFEIKHMEMSDYEKEELFRINQEMRKRKHCSWKVPNRNQSFKNLLSNSEKKFLKYDNFSTAVICDISEYGLLCPDLESMIGGIMQITISSSGANKIKKIKYIDRSLRLDNRVEIGAIGFITNEKIYLVHNLMSYKTRMLPDFLCKEEIGNCKLEQLILFNPPGKEMVLKKVRDMSSYII